MRHSVGGTIKASAKTRATADAYRFLGGKYAKPLTHRETVIRVECVSTAASILDRYLGVRAGNRLSMTAGTESGRRDRILGIELSERAR